jgi:hypothetical protein
MREKLYTWWYMYVRVRLCHVDFTSEVKAAWRDAGFSNTRSYNACDYST